MRAAMPLVAQCRVSVSEAPRASGGVRSGEGQSPFRAALPYGATNQTQNGMVTIAAICSVVVIAAISGASPPIARAIT